MLDGYGRVRCLEWSALRCALLLVLPQPWRLPGGDNDGAGALEVVGDGGEMNLDGGLDETPPSHSPQSIAALPGSEDLLDPGTHAVDRLVPALKASERLSFVAAPNAGSNDAGRSSLGANRAAAMVPTMGAVGEHLAGVVGPGSLGRASGPARQSLMLVG